MLVIKEKIISIYPDFLGGTIIQPQLVIENSAFIYLFNLKKFVVVLHRHAKCRILVLQPGFKPGPPDFPGGAVVKNLPANAGDVGSSLGLGRSHMPWSN